MLGAQVPVRLILVQIKGLPGNFEPGSGKVTQAVPEQVIVIGLEVDFGTLRHQSAVLQQLARVGQAVLVAASVFAPRVAEVDVDALHGIRRAEHAGKPLDIQRGDLDIIRRQLSGGVSGFHLALGQNQNLIRDINAKVVDIRVQGGQLAQKAALAAAKLQVQGLLRPGIQLMPVPGMGQRFVNMEIAGQQFRSGIGLKTHTHTTIPHS